MGTFVVGKKHTSTTSLTAMFRSCAWEGVEEDAVVENKEANEIEAVREKRLVLM
jgi:hypothetical protein